MMYRTKSRFDSVALEVIFVGRGEEGKKKEKYVGFLIFRDLADRQLHFNLASAIVSHRMFRGC